jgi:L-rhamnonate dehydratase
MSGYAKYRERRSSWGISVIGSLVVEIETEAGVTGVAPPRWPLPASRQGC